MIAFAIPGIRLVSVRNKREHWSATSKRARGHRNTGFLYTLAALKKYRPQQPMRITITRIGKRRMDSDGVSDACKNLRDGIADALRINDGDPKAATWHYAQEIGKEYACRVEIESAEGTGQ